MKMVYETPKMKAELFQASEYVNACTRDHYFTGKMFVWLDGVQYWFSDSSKRYMVNQNSGDTQWYWTEDSNPKLYLEYSAHISKQTGQDTFIMYEEAEGASGFYDNLGSDTPYDWRDDEWVLMDTGIDYGSTLQVNTGGEGTGYAAQEGMKQTSTWYLDLNGERQQADGWYADHSLGVVDDIQDDIVMMNS